MKWKVLAMVVLSFVVVASIAAAATVTAFAIAEQSPGSVTFSLLANAPTNVSVTNTCYDEASAPILEQTAPVGDWVAGNGGSVGYATFDTSSVTGAPCFAYVHRGRSRQPLGTFSYTAP